MKNKKFFCPILVVTTMLICQAGKAIETPSDPMREQGQNRYDALLKSLPKIADDTSIFWQVGMGFESIIEFGHISQKNLNEVGEIARKIFDNKLNQSDWWWDDFGWWGFIFAKLYQYTNNSQYFDLAASCLSRMLRSKEAFAACPDPQKLEETPMFKGGCYNTALSYPHPDAEQGIENTVTNAQFLRLAIALFKITYNNYNQHQTKESVVETYWAELKDQYTWFLSWFNQGLVNNSFAGEHHILIEERVSKYKNGQVAFSYMEKRFWTGDQGLMLMAFTDLAYIHDMLSKNNPLKLDYAFLENSLQYAIYLAKGVQKWLITSKDDSTILSYERTQFDDFPFDYEQDYKTGPSVFFSSLIHSARNHQPQILEKLQQDGYKLIIDKNYHVATERSYDIQNLDDFIQVATDLSAINLAIFSRELIRSKPSFFDTIFSRLFGVKK